MGLFFNMKSTKHRIGKELKDRREALKLSQDVLAEKMGVQRTTISKIENGVFSASLDQLEKFEKALDFKLKMIPNEEN